MKLLRHSFVHLLLLASWFALPAGVFAHASGESYVWLNVESDHLEGRFELRLADLRSQLELEVPTDPDGARRVIRESAAEVERYLQEKFEILIDGRSVPYRFGAADLVEIEGLEGFAQYPYSTAAIQVPSTVDIRNEVFRGGDRFHRSLLLIEYDRQRDKQYGEEFTAMVFGVGSAVQTLDLDNVRGLMRVPAFVWQGMLHIWIGIDHVLFLVVLLLTAVLVREGSKWQPVPDFRQGLWNIVKIITAFTIAHSITLSLAALDLVRLPSRWVESIIALSIVLMAVTNLRPRFRHGHWLLIFGFGLFHGLGFASVMGELPFRMYKLVPVLLAFNVGVEIGQLAIVLVVFPVLFWLRRWRHYERVVLGGGSIVIGVLALWWFIERAFEI